MNLSILQKEDFLYYSFFCVYIPEMLTPIPGILTPLWG